MCGTWKSLPRILWCCVRPAPDPSWPFRRTTYALLPAAEWEDVRIWDLRGPDAPPIVFRAGKAAIRSVAISAEGGYLAVGDAQGNVWLWRLWTAAADYLCTRVSRNLSLEEWRIYVGESIPLRTHVPFAACRYWCSVSTNTGWKSL